MKRRAELRRHYTMAKVADDQEVAGEAKEAIQGFNDANPDRRINALQMAASVRTRRKQIEGRTRAFICRRNAGTL